jgi:hypothetical protein
MREEGEASRARTGETATNWETEKREYSRSMGERLDRIDRELEQERTRAENGQMSAEARREYNERVSELDNVRREAREQWNKLESATQDAWQDFKGDMDRTANRLDQAWERFRADLRR